MSSVAVWGHIRPGAPGGQLVLGLGVEGRCLGRPHPHYPEGQILVRGKVGFVSIQCGG